MSEHRSTRRAASLAVVASLILAGMATDAAAQTRTWDGGGSDGLWSTGLNWVGDAAPATTGTTALRFTGTTQLLTNNDLLITGSIGSITFANTGAAGLEGNFTLAGNQINLSGGITTSAVSTGTLTDTISLGIRFVPGGTISGGWRHNLVLSGTLSSDVNNRVVTFGNPGVKTITGTANTFGSALIDLGLLSVRLLGNSGSASSIGVESFFRMGSQSIVISAQVPGEFNSYLSYAGAGESTNKTVTMFPTQSINVRTAQSQISSDGTGGITFTSGTWITPTLSYSVGGSYGRLMTLSGSSDTVNTIQGRILDFASYGTGRYGSVQIVKSGVTTWVFSGSNSYSGGTTINAGTLRAGSDSALGAATGGLVINGGSLDLGGRSIVVGGLTGASVGQITSATAGAAALTVSPVGTTGYAGAIGDGSGTVSLTKIGGGTLVIAGSNSYTGATTVNGGTLAVSFANFPSLGVAGANAIRPSSALALGGGALQLQGVAGGTTSQAFASLAVNSGAGGIVLSGTNVLLSVGAITRSPGGTLDITQPGGSLGAANGVVTTSANTGGILGGYATVAGANWAVANGGSAITALGSYANDTWASGTNTTVTADTTQTNATTNSLRFAANAARIVTLSGVNTLTSGGVLVTGGVGANTSTITGGSLVGAAAADLVINQHNTAGDLVIASTVADNGGATGVTKSGAGRATLSSANTFTGTATVNAGTLVLGAANSPAATRINGGTLEYGATGALGSGGLTFAGNGTLRAAVSGTLTNAIAVNANTTASLQSTDAGAVLGGVISGAGGVTKAGAGTLRLAGNNTYTGMTTVNGGVLSLTGSGGNRGGTTINSGTLLLDFANGATGTNIIDATQNVALNGGTLLVAGRANMANLQSGTGLQLTAGDSRVILSASTSNPLLYKIEYLARDALSASTVDFTLPAGTQSGSNGIVISSVNNTGANTNNIIGGYATVNGTDWATYQTANGNVIPLASGSYTANAWASGSNTTVTSGTTFSAAQTTNSLRFNSPGAFTLSFNTASASQVQSGGILVTSNVGANTSTISGGPITGPNGGDLIVIQNNTQGGLTISSTVQPANTTPAFMGLTKSGPGVLTLSSSNSFNGLTVVNGGTLVLGNPGAIAMSVLNTSGAGAVSFGSLTAASMAQLTGTGNVDLTSSAGGVALSLLGVRNYASVALGNTFDYGGVLSGSASVAINLAAKTGVGLDYSDVIVFPTQVFSGLNTYSGSTAIVSGTLAVTTLADGGAASSIGNSSSAASNLVFSGNDVGLRYIGGGNSTNRNFTVSGSATLEASGYGPLVMSGTAAYGTSGQTRFLFLQGLNGGDNTLSGNFANNGSGALSILKSGSGTWVLSGSNTFTGGVRIAAGTLGVGSSNALGTGTASFTGNATLRAGISGTLANRIDVASGAVTTVDTQSNNFAISTAITGSGGLTKAGSGRLQLTAANTFSGTTTVSAGRLLVDGAGNLANTARVVVNGSDADLRWNSSTALAVPLTVSQGTVSGSGTISSPGGVSIGSGAIISPGNSPGIQSYTTGLTWAAGGTYIWEVNDWNGTAGNVNNGFDQIAVSGSALNVTATGGSPFTIRVTGLAASNAQGVVPNFSSGTVGKTFVIATSSAGITGLGSTNVVVDGTTAFTNNNPLPTGAGFWLSQSGNNVILNYAPSAVYDLAATASGTSIRVGGSSTLTATITSSTAAVTNPDSLAYSGLSLPGAGALSSTSGTLAGGAAGSGSVSFTGTAAGAYAFTPSLSTATNVNLGSNANAGSTSGVTVNVFNPAAANTLSGSVNLGAVLVGTPLSQTLSIVNTAASGSFTERLDAGFGTLTGGVTTNSGTISLLVAGNTSTAMSVFLASGSAGAASGSALVNFATDGQGTSGLSALGLPSQTVTLTATVLDPGLASFTSGSTTTSLLLDFGTVNQNASVSPLGFDFFNIMQTGGYTADLALLSITADPGNFAAITTTATSTFLDLAAGNSNAYTAALSTVATGSFTNIYTFQFKSANNSTVYTGDTPQSLTLTVKGFVAVPEPAGIALAAAGLAGLAFLRVRRRRAAAREG